MSDVSDFRVDLAWFNLGCGAAAADTGIIDTVWAHNGVVRADAECGKHD